MPYAFAMITDWIFDENLEAFLLTVGHIVGIR